jgi:hypothetical protein
MGEIEGMVGDPHLAHDPCTLLISDRIQAAALFKILD